LSEAEAAKVTVPEIVAPETGEVIETVGGVASEPVAVVNVKSPLVERRPAEFFDLTR
jgi:hypothetical protein